MKSLRTIFPVLGVALALAGCSAETGTNGGANSVNDNGSSTALSTDAPATEVAGDSQQGPRGHRPGGPDFLVFASLHEDIGLTDAQRATIQGLVQAKPALADVAQRKPDAAHATALASAIRAGKVDLVKLDAPDATARETFMREHLAQSAKNLATLHATLTPEQRAKLVDAIAAKHANGPQGPRGPHERRPHAGGAPGEHGPLGGLLADLELTPAQKEAIKTKLDALKPADAQRPDREAMKAKFDEMKKEMDAKLQTFKGDAFDASAFATPPASMPKFTPSQDHRSAELSAIVSVLDQSQREKLAQKIEQGPQRAVRQAQ